MTNEIPRPTPTLEEKVYFLSEILKVKAIWRGQKIGRLADLVVAETGKIPEVSHVYITRPFGAPSLLVPWEKVQVLSTDEIVIEYEKLEVYQDKPKEEAILLKDHILDKKVLDLEDREVSIVYDVRLVLRNNKLYVTDVDFSRYGLLRRMGLKGIADFIYNLAFMSAAKSLYNPKLAFLSKLIYPLANTVKDKRISWSYIQPLGNVGSFKGDVKLKVVKETLEDIPPVDLADILEELDHDQRVAIFSQLDPDHASDTLEEIDPNVQRALVSSLQKEKVAQLVNEMTPAQAADILSILPLADANMILSLLKKENAGKIRVILEKQEEKILNYATSKVLKQDPDVTVGQAQENYRHLAKDKDVVMYVYVVGADEKLLGVLDIKELLQANEESKLREIMVDQVITLHPDSTLKEASDIFSRYGFRAIPIVDDAEKMLGVIPYRDVMNLKHRFVE